MNPNQFEEKRRSAMLRAEAEAQLAHAPAAGALTRPAEELLHELRVHQIELEMQNEELRSAQAALEESRDRYVDLYEFAPVGYLTLSREGMIAKINLTGATLLGVERKKLARRRFAALVAPEDSDRWHLHLINMATHEIGRQKFELALKRGDGSFFHAQLDCLRVDGADGVDDAPPVVRVTFADISDKKQAEQQLRELSAHLQSVREEEKARLAREIHDDLGSTLTALNMEAYRLAGKLSVKEEMAPLREHVESLSRLIDNAVEATRSIIGDLRPAVLDDFGLLAALEWHCDQFFQRTGIACQVAGAGASDDDKNRLDDEQSINLFRLSQEALANVARHSGASRVEVELRLGEKEAFLSISDNGCGLPADCANASTSYGMRGMVERIKHLGGTLEFDAAPGGGTTVTVKLPLHGRAICA